jgi:protein-tyrosine phosphatase
MTGFWQRDLNMDLDVIEKWGARTVVTLIEDKEVRYLRVQQLGAELLNRGIVWHHLPIRDGSVPNPKFERTWTIAGTEIRSTLERAQNVLVHCRGGLGRAGTIAARLLVEFGIAPEEAIEKVRNARPGAIETPEQMAYIMHLTRSNA